jgi:hypothetical protein
MRIAGTYYLGLFLVSAASMMLHDVLVFSEVRERIDRTIADLTPSEARPTPVVRTVFGLDSPALYWNKAFDLYRYEAATRDWNHFHAYKVPATPIWMFELWIWYDRRSVEALSLRTMCCSVVSERGADGVARAAFGRGLNDLSRNELECVVKLARTGSARRVCYAIGRLVPERN